MLKMKSKMYANVGIDPTRERVCKACKRVKSLTDFKINENFRTPASIKKYPSNGYHHFCLECWDKPRECNGPLVDDCQESATRWFYVRKISYQWVMSFCEKHSSKFTSTWGARFAVEEISEDEGRSLRDAQRIVNG
jgi:hypothetical protein